MIPTPKIVHFSVLSPNFTKNYPDVFGLCSSVCGVGGWVQQERRQFSRRQVVGDALPAGDTLWRNAVSIEQPIWRNLAPVLTVTGSCKNIRQLVLLISRPVYCGKETEMRLELDGYNPIGTDTGGLDMDTTSSNSGLPFPEKSVPSLNLTSDLSLAQQKGQAAVDLYRIW